MTEKKKEINFLFLYPNFSLSDKTKKFEDFIGLVMLPNVNKVTTSQRNPVYCWQDIAS